MSYYEKKLAFVFGGSEGIGASVCKGLIEKGAHVVAFSRSEEKLKELCIQFLAKTPDANIHTISLDVTDFHSVSRVIENAVNRFGVPFFVMNFAGMAKPGFIENQKIEEFREMIEINYFGTANVIKALSKHLIKNKGAHVVNCSSMAGFLGLFGYTGYCASKFAVIGFSEALRREWSPYGIKVSVLCPPNTKTPGLVQENKNKPAEILAAEEKVVTVDPDFVATNLLKKLPKGEFLIVPTFDGRLANYLNRLSPRIIDLFVKRKSVSPISQVSN